MRRMHVLTNDGVETLPIRSDEAASVIGTALERGQGVPGHR